MRRDKDYTAIMAARVDDCPVPAVPSMKRPCVECGYTCWVDPRSLYGNDFVQLLGVNPLVTGERSLSPLPRRVLCMRCLAKITGFGDALGDAIDTAKARKLKRGRRR